MLDPDEESFWHEMIDKYLKPIHSDSQEQGIEDLVIYLFRIRWPKQKYFLIRK